MTEDRMALIELVEKQADGHLLREMLAFAADRLMDAEVDAREGNESARGTSIKHEFFTGIRPTPRWGFGAAA